MDPARLAAYDVLAAVRLEDAYVNLVLPRVLRERQVQGRDAAFATELVSGTVRRQGTYDAVIDACLDKPKLEARVRDALRLGVHQLLATRVPPHAAISTTVDLVRARVGQGPAGLTNAVLRRVGEHPLDAWVRRLAPDPTSDPVGFAALAHSHPRWVVGGLLEALGERAGELEALLAADNARPRVTLVARPGACDVEELPGDPGAYSPYARVLTGGDPGAVPAVAEGRAGVQDEGSQVVTLAFAGAPLDGPDRLWLDACAGPGGKAALLAGLAATRGARVLAAERLPHRAALVRTSTRAVTAGLAGVVAADGTRAPWAEGTFDRVLLDVPCSGLGALRRRPEARWRRTPQDVGELVALQRALLAEAVRAVRPGGLVGYVTCSPLLAETAEVVAEAVDGGGVEVVRTRLDGSAPLAGPVTESEGPVPGTVQLWPHRHGTDAMFLAVLRRVG